MLRILRYYKKTSGFVKIKMCRINCDSYFLLTSFDSLEYKTSLHFWYVFDQTALKIILNFPEA